MDRVMLIFIAVLALAFVGADIHAGPWNNESVGAAFQGTFRSHSDGETGIEPSEEQKAAWTDLLPYLLERHGIDVYELWPHAWRGKPSCPGHTIIRWLLDERLTCPSSLTPREQLAVVMELPELVSAKEDLTGLETRRLIERFQRSQKVIDIFGRSHPALVVDGLLGPATETMLRRVLRERGML